MRMPIPRWALITLGAAVVLGLAVAIPYKLMLTDDLAGKYNPAPSQEVLRTAAKAMLTSEPVKFSEAEINAFTAYHLPDVQSYMGKAEYQPNQIYLTFPKENTITAYTPVTWNGKNLGVTSQSKVMYDAATEQLRVEIQQVRLGKLSVSPKFALNRLFGKELPSGITRKDNVILVDVKPFLHSEKAVKTGFALGMFQVQENGILFQATTTLSDAGNKVRDYVKDWLGKNVSGDIDVNELEDKLLEYLKKNSIT